ncbi:MAG: hypothetical protein MUP52_02600 [Candidatus Aminicenantes bacterium]|nr:hypothetical protein [Candidatus Aminicenantes bacterium]
MIGKDRIQEILREKRPAFELIVLCLAALLLGLLFIKNLMFFLLFCVAVAGLALFLWLSSVRKETLLTFALMIMLWLGFLHAPFTSGNYVFWLQELLILACLSVMMMRRGKHTRPAFWPILIPYGIVCFMTLVPTLNNESLVTYLNGVRRIAIAPLLFILGQLLAQERSSRTAFRVFLWTFVLQLPACLILIYWHTGSFFQLPGADLLTGTFGRGGTGYIVIFMSAVLGISVWLFAKRQLSLKILALLSGIFLVLGRWSDLKFIYLLLPLTLGVAFLLVVRQRSSSRKWKALVAELAGLTILFVVLLLVISASSVRFHSGTLAISSMFNPDYIRQALFVDSKGIVTSNEGREFSRYGVLVYALNFISRDFVTRAAGHGLGSTATEGALGETKLGQMVGIRNIDYSTLSVLLFETGIGGTLLYLAPFCILMASAFFSLRKKKVLGTDLEILSGMVVLYGFCLLASLPYNGFAVTPRGGGVFWLLGGLWYAARRKAFSKAEGLPHDTDEQGVQHAPPKS